MKQLIGIEVFNDRHGGYRLFRLIFFIFRLSFAFATPAKSLPLVVIVASCKISCKEYTVSAIRTWVIEYQSLTVSSLNLRSIF